MKKQELDSDIQREYNRQRDYLEKSVENLKKKLLKDSDVHRQDNTRVLQENVQLIIEINNLRREIDYLKRERQQQRLHVSKLKSTTKSSTASGGSGPSSHRVVACTPCLNSGTCNASCRKVRARSTSAHT